LKKFTKRVSTTFVIPAKAGIQPFWETFLDSRLRGNDGQRDFSKS
jgi:hypothetical protein